MSGDSETLPVGCFSNGYKRTPLLSSGPNEPSSALDALACQSRCKSTTGCKYFAFSPKKLACYMSGDGASVVEADDLDMVSGPAECREALGVAGVCTQVPDFHFPGLNKEESQQAWSPVQQPLNLQCWPRTHNGSKLAECPSSRAKVVEDTNEGWDGRCDGMQKTSLPPERCQVECMQDPLCAVWQWRHMDGASGKEHLECLHGALGTNCYNRTTGYRPVRAQRILHGTFRVLRRLRRVQIIGLVEAFSGSVFINSENAAAHCRLICISALYCQYWQYSDTHGCWVEDAINQGRVPYPLVNNGHMMKTDSPQAYEMSEGEFIQHICEDGVEAPLPTDLPRVTTTTTLLPTTTALRLGGGVASSDERTVINDVRDGDLHVGKDDGDVVVSGTDAQGDFTKEVKAPALAVREGELGVTPTAAAQVAVIDREMGCHRRRCLRLHGDHGEDVWVSDEQCCAPPGQGACRRGFQMLDISQSCTGIDAELGIEMDQTCCVSDGGHIPWPVITLIITGVIFALICCGAWLLAAMRRKQHSRSTRSASLTAQGAAADGYRSDSSMDSRQAAPISPYGTQQQMLSFAPPPPCGHAPYGLPASLRSASFSPPGVPLQ